MSKSGTSATMVRESGSTGSTDAEIAPVENPQDIADFSEAAISDAQSQAAPPGNFENLQSASGASTVSSASSSIFFAATIAETGGKQSSPASGNPEGAHRTDATATLANVSTEFSATSALDIAALQNPFLPGHFGSAHSPDAQSLPNAPTFPLQKDTPAQSMFMRASGLSAHGSSDNPASTAPAGDSPSGNFQSSAGVGDASSPNAQNGSGQNPSSQNPDSQNSSSQNPGLRDSGSRHGNSATALAAMAAQPDPTAPANVASGAALVDPQASATQSSTTETNPIPTQSSGARANTVAEAALPESSGTPCTSLVQAAQMMNRVAQSEMRIGLNTPSFGSVEVRTVVQANEVGLVIGSEKGDLHSLLAPEIPGIVSNLQQQNLRLHQVDFHQGSAFSGNLSSGGGDPRPKYFAPPPTSPALAESGADDAAVSTNEIRSIGSTGLNILA